MRSAIASMTRSHSLQLVEVLLVVRLLDQRGVFGHAERRGLELLQALDGLGDDAVLRPFLGGQVEQDHRHLDVDEVGGDLRAHDAGAEHGDLADVESVHRVSIAVHRRASFDADQVCVRPSIGMPM